MKSGIQRYEESAVIPAPAKAVFDFIDDHNNLSAHMNQSSWMMGKEGEEQMHVVMGQRLSGCQAEAQFPQTGAGFMPMMMWMMGSAGSPQVGGGENQMMGYGGWNNMMGGWGGASIIGGITMIVFWLLVILGVVALVRYLGGPARSGDRSSSALDILKQRYAKGEIDKREFEEKKDLL